MALGDNIAVLAGNSGKVFARKLASELENKISTKLNDGPILIDTTTIYFANTELLVNIDGSVRGKDVYVVADCENHSNGCTVDTNFNEAKQLIAAAKSSAARVNVILPLFPYSRQDVARGNQPVTMKLKVEEVQEAKKPSFTGDIITFDIHNRATLAYADGQPMLNLFASKVIIPYIRDSLELTDLVIVSPDSGGVERAEHYAGRLNTGVGYTFKRREYTKQNVSYAQGYHGDAVANNQVLILDDMIDTGTSIINSIELLKREGAQDIYVATTHALFNVKTDEYGVNKDPVKIFSQFYNDNVLSQVLITDTVNNGRVDLSKYEWCTELSVASLCASVVRKLHFGESISEFLE